MEDNCDKLTSLINVDLKTINEWMGDNRLIVNSNKSYFMFFGSDHLLLKMANSNSLRNTMENFFLKNEKRKLEDGAKIPFGEVEFTFRELIFHSNKII